MRARLVAIVWLTACGAPAARTEAPPPERAPAPRDLAVAEPPPKPPPDAGAEHVSRDVVILRDQLDPPHARRGRIEPVEIGVAERYFWGPCVRDFVQALPEDTRRAVTAVFARYAVTCDAERRVVVAPSHDYRGRSFVAYSGTFTRDRANVALTITMCGAAPAFEHVTIVHDGRSWTAGRPDTELVDGCTIASFPDVRSLRRVLRDVVDARDAAVRVDGDDLPITDDMRRDLRLMLDALDAFSAR